MNAQVWTGILLPFLGTSLGAAMVFVLKDKISDGIQRMLTGFAAGAIMYVVVEELIPEMSEGEHSNVGTVAFALGFVLMMVLDVALV